MKNQGNPRKPKETQGNPRKPEETRDDLAILQSEKSRKPEENPRKLEETQTNFTILWYFQVFLSFTKLFQRKYEDTLGNPD